MGLLWVERRGEKEGWRGEAKWGRQSGETEEERKSKYEDVWGEKEKGGDRRKEGGR